MPAPKSDHMTWTFRVRGRGTDKIEIDIYDAVGDYWGDGVAAKDVRSTLRDARQAKQIDVRINSAGGDVVEGFAIYSLLRDHPAKVAVYVDSLAASIASVIAMAGDEIVMAENAFMMIHNPWGFAIGDAEDMRRQADLLDKMRDTIVDVYVARTGQARESVVAAVEAETWMTATEAQELGYATEVVPLKKKPSADGAAAAAWNLARFARVPPAVMAALRECNRADVTEAKPPPAEPRKAMDPKDNKPETETAAGEKLLAIAASNDFERSVMTLVGASSPAEAIGKISAFVETAQKWTTISARLKEIETATAKAESSRLIDDATKAGRLTPAMREKANALYERFGIEALKAHLEALPQTVAAESKELEGPAPIVLSADELEVCRLMGTKPEDYKRHKAKMIADGRI